MTTRRALNRYSCSEPDANGQCHQPVVHWYETRGAEIRFLCDYHRRARNHATAARGPFRIIDTPQADWMARPA